MTPSPDTLESGRELDALRTGISDAVIQLRMLSDVLRSDGKRNPTAGYVESVCKDLSALLAVAKEVK